MRQQKVLRVVHQPGDFVSSAVAQPPAKVHENKASLGEFPLLLHALVFNKEELNRFVGLGNAMPQIKFHITNPDAVTLVHCSTRSFDTHCPQICRTQLGRGTMIEKEAPVSSQ
jgi:hypothetical protein